MPERRCAALALPDSAPSCPASGLMLCTLCAQPWRACAAHWLHRLAWPAKRLRGDVPSHPAPPLSPARWRCIPTTATTRCWPGALRTTCTSRPSPLSARQTPSPSSQGRSRWCSCRMRRCRRVRRATPQSAVQWSVRLQQGRSRREGVRGGARVRRAAHSWGGCTQPPRWRGLPAITSRRHAAPGALTACRRWRGAAARMSARC